MNIATPKPVPASTSPISVVEPATMPAPSFAARLRPTLDNLLPPLVVVLALLGLWEVVASGPNATLPPPSKVWTDAGELITDPFFDRGGLDKGLFWHLLASLQRVAVGFALSVVAGIATGLLIGTSPLATRGLDPLFQVLRTVPPLAWLPLLLAAFREAQPSAIFVIFITSV